MPQSKPTEPTPFDAKLCPAAHDVLSPRPGQPQVIVGLEDIEQAALKLGCEVLPGPHKIRLVRTLYRYRPFAEAGPGMWSCESGDELLAAALEAWAFNDITPAMIRAIRPEDFAAGPLKDRLAEETEAAVEA